MPSFNSTASQTATGVRIASAMPSYSSLNTAISPYSKQVAFIHLRFHVNLVVKVFFYTNIPRLTVLCPVHLSCLKDIVKINCQLFHIFRHFG